MSSPHWTTGQTSTCVSFTTTNRVQYEWYVYNSGFGRFSTYAIPEFENAMEFAEMIETLNPRSLTLHMRRPMTKEKAQKFLDAGFKSAGDLMSVTKDY